MENQNFHHEKQLQSRRKKPKRFLSFVIKKL